MMQVTISRPLRSERSERGQSMTEFALSLTVLLFIVVGVLDLGRMYMTYVALQNAAGEGALYAAIHPTWVDTCPSGAFGCNNSAYDNITARTRNEAPAGTLIDWTSPDFSMDPPSLPGGNVEGQPVVITLHYNYRLFTPMLSAIWPQLPLTASATQLILGH